MANLNIYQKDLDVHLTARDNNATHLLEKYMTQADFEGLLVLKTVPKTDVLANKIVKSSFDAAQVCELLHIDYLIYGFVEKSHKYYNAEVRLYENSSKSNRKIFYVKTDVMEMDAVLKELSSKFIKYMYDILGLSKAQKERQRGFGGVGIYYANGYWIPIGDWWSVITGIVSFELGVNVIPITPIVKKRNFAFFMRYGFYASYSLGINKPDHLSAYFNSIIFRIPAEFCFEVFFRNVFIIGAGPQVQLDILYQKMLYDDPRININAVFSAYCGLSYEHWFGKRKRFAIGTAHRFDFSFYTPLYIDYKLDFYITIRIPTMNEKLFELE